jgi:hypothetical protein
VASTSESEGVAANPIGRIAEISEIDRFLDRMSVGLARPHGIEFIPADDEGADD